MAIFIGKDRDPLIRDPKIICLLSLIEAILSHVDYYVSLLSLTKAILSLINSYISLSSFIEAIFQRVSKWGSLSFPVKSPYTVGGKHDAP